MLSPKSLHHVRLGAQYAAPALSKNHRCLATGALAGLGGCAANAITTRIEPCENTAARMSFPTEPLPLLRLIVR